MNSKFDSASIITASYALVVVINFGLVAYFGAGALARPIVAGFAQFQKVYEDAFLFDGLKILAGIALATILTAWRRLKR